VYGGALIAAGMVGAAAVTYWPPPTWLRVAVYIVAFIAILAGILMTFRDLS
jgi:hypothetical protein